jgi:predicted ArsR family transcriptional regulator
MDLELADLFKTKEQKLTCAKPLELLRERGELEQKQIAEALDINEMAVSRTVKKLEATGYLKHRRAKRGKWFVSL